MDGRSYQLAMKLMGFGHGQLAERAILARKTDRTKIGLAVRVDLTVSVRDIGPEPTHRVGNRGDSPGNYADCEGGL